MKPVLVFFGMLAFIGLLVVGVIQIALPPLMNWHAAGCLESADLSLVCTASAWALSYWWLGMFPLVAVGSFLATGAVFDRTTNNGE